LFFDENNDFGLTQASTNLAEDGSVFINGITKFELPLIRVLLRVAGIDLSKTKVIDPQILIKQITESVLSAKRIIAGAGGGLIKFPAKLDMGVRFNFELGDVDRLQKYGDAAVKAIRNAILAQADYNKSTEDFAKRAKNNATGEVSVGFSAVNESKRTFAEVNTNIVRFMSEFEKLTNAFDKAYYTLKAANLADAVEQEFAPLLDLVKGFTKDY
jgi:hypothetical protein